MIPDLANEAVRLGILGLSLQISATSSCAVVLVHLFSGYPSQNCDMLFHSRLHAKLILKHLTTSKNEEGCEGEGWRKGGKGGRESVEGRKPISSWTEDLIFKVAPEPLH